MIKRTTKLRWRRIVRKRKRQVEEIGSTTEQSIEKHLIRRLMRLPNVRRFLAGWIGLLFLLAVGVILQTRMLSTTYQDVQPKSGGTYREGMIGTFTNANPLYASSSVDSSVSRLVFAGLLKYDENNKLVGDLADHWSVDETERVYTVTLKDKLRWHDGKALTAKDVVFTYKTIQNPETKSSLYPSWQNIKIESTDDRTVVFTLASNLSAFPHSLTNGIIPQHILGSVNPSQLRSNTFNNVAPVGSGPFMFSKVEVVGETPEDRQERIALSAFDAYHFGRPKLDSFIIRTFSQEENLIDAYHDKQINAMAGLESLPESLQDKSDTAELTVPLTGEVLVFFKTTQAVLQDSSVRKALVLAVDKDALFKDFAYPVVSIDEPFLRTHAGYDKAFRQVTGQLDAAKEQLDAAGWVVDPASGIRSKDGTKLSFRLNSQGTEEYSKIASGLQRQWRALGVDMQVELQSDQELQNTLALHTYDALLYGISLGADPDIFAYWHGSQADPRSSTRLNFSEYKSRTADQALEAGRTRSDAQLRAVKYRPFLEAWRNDAPALALYQPRLVYVVRKPISGFELRTANTAADRFVNIERWTIREGLQ